MSETVWLNGVPLAVICRGSSIIRANGSCEVAANSIVPSAPTSTSIAATCERTSDCWPRYVSTTLPPPGPGACRTNNASASSVVVAATWLGPAGGETIACASTNTRNPSGATCPGNGDAHSAELFACDAPSTASADRKTPVVNGPDGSVLFTFTGGAKLLVT